MSLLNTLKIIINHPLNSNRKWKSIAKFFKWQIGTRLNPYPIIYPYAEKSKFIIKRGLTGATGNLYCGLHEFEDMTFVLHFLRKTDLFVDIGANVGSYTLLGANEKGAKTISIEPIPETFQSLESNIIINNIEDKVISLNIGLGKEKGILKFTKSFDTTNHVATAEDTDTINVNIEKFDDIIHLEQQTLVKIDVEGYETEVINGMSNSIANNNLKAIIIELNGSGTRYGYDENKIHEKLLANNFKPYRYLPFERKLIPLERYGNLNTIYIKDFEFVNKRINSARKIKIYDREI